MLTDVNSLASISILFIFSRCSVKSALSNMKKPLIITGCIILAFFLLFLINSIFSRKGTEELFTEVQKGDFEISISTAGELTAQNSLDILGPEMATGRDIRSTQIRIQDIVPEGTIVRKGDYIATLDRTELSNNLKDAYENLTRLKTNLEVKLLDTAVVLSGLRDAIKNQEFAVDEAALKFKNSKYEPPTVIRQAEINLYQAQRVLDQRKRSYTRVFAQNKTDIANQNYWLARMERRVKDMEEVLAGFTVLAPGNGMVIYKKEWRGNKRKAGSMINPIDRVVATLPDLSVMISKIYVSEIEVAKVKKGQQVEIGIDAFPGKQFKGTVTFIANIGENLPNTTDKVFEVQVKVDGSDPLLRPSMTTSNKIIVDRINDAVFIPIECVQAGVDSIPFVYRKNGFRQVVVTGEANDKNMIIEKGLEPGAMIYLNNPLKAEKFRLAGEELIPVVKEGNRIKKDINVSSRIVKESQLSE
jgi:multidrug efflux pump subunit AcrA (membrane-fusion protein)